MFDWLRHVKRVWPLQAPAAIPDALWHTTLARYPFLTPAAQRHTAKLRALTERFLAHKEFSGANGLVITDEMAVAIAAQACLPVLHIGLSGYEDFKGIVVHPGAMRARRQRVDNAGVVHAYTEELSGEAMEGGPVTLSWADVTGAADVADVAGLNRSSSDSGYNVVIHEFVHKLDMRTGVADGCPPLHTPWLRQHWPDVMQRSYDSFREAVTMAERFGAPAPWLDAYAATAPAEFFAVASEAFFMKPERLREDFPELCEVLEAFFRP